VIFLKLDKGKKIMALLLTSTILFPNMALASENKVNTYIDDGKLIISDYGNYEFRIDEDELDNLIENGDSVRFNIGDDEVLIDSDSLLKLKNEAIEKEKELNGYKALIYTSFGVITLLIVRNNIRKTIIKKF